MLIFYYYFRFKVRIVKPINHGAKILSLRRPNDNANSFWGLLKETRLHDLVYLGYVTVPHDLVYLTTMEDGYAGMRNYS